MLCVAYSRISPEYNNTTTPIQTVDFFPLDLYSGPVYGSQAIIQNPQIDIYSFTTRWIQGTTSDEKICEISEDVWWQARGRKAPCLGLIYGGGSMCGDRLQLNMPGVSRCASHAAADLGSTSEGAQQCSTAPALGERAELKRRALTSRGPR